jgi:hypothetical protein
LTKSQTLTRGVEEDGGFSYRGEINTNPFLLIETLEKFEKIPIITYIISNIFAKNQRDWIRT